MLQMQRAQGKAALLDLQRVSCTCPLLIRQPYFERVSVFCMQFDSEQVCQLPCEPNVACAERWHRCVAHSTAMSHSHALSRCVTFCTACYTITLSVYASFDSVLFTHYISDMWLCHVTISHKCAPSCRRTRWVLVLRSSGLHTCFHRNCKQHVGATISVA